MAETYYDVLGVAPDATQDEIQAAYRERVKETHPDVSDAPDASERFREVTRAEEVLGDEAERARYDRLGHEAYVGRVTGENAAGAEQSPWTASESAGATDPSDAAEQWATDGDPRDRRGTDRDDGRRAGGTAEATTDRTAGASSDAAGRSRSSRRQQFYRERSESGGTGYAVRDWGEAAARENRVSVPLTPDRVVFLAGMVFLYPVMVASTLFPPFPLVARLVVGGCTLLVTGYLLTVPPLGILLFGVLSVLAPLGVVAFSVDPLSVPALAAVGLPWSLFAFAVVVERALRP
ncbi:DnaJ domain-containing protein [Halostella litorea]|uniref:DnaJ domain-containing protein n=1 Tax=Halostella litorea TaxID=2528831 RepID=UPI00109318F9|nr:DnaJ domain-containing protein [Halostella litorea]